MSYVNTETSVRLSKKTHNEFTYQRDEHDFLYRVISRWDDTPNDVKELQGSYTHERDVIIAIDTYQAKVKQKETDLMSKLLKRANV